MLASYERELLIHRDMRRNLAVRRPANGKDCARDGRQPASPTLSRADELFIPPVGSLVSGGFGPFLVEPDDPAGRGAHPSILERGEECRERAWPKPGLGVSEDDDLAAARCEDGGLSRRLATARQVEQPDPRVLPGGRHRDLCCLVCRTVGSDDHVQFERDLLREDVRDPITKLGGLVMDGDPDRDDRGSGITGPNPERPDGGDEPCGRRVADVDPHEQARRDPEDQGDHGPRVDPE